MYGEIIMVLFILFLNHNQTLNADLYSQQLLCVHKNLLRKCLALVNKKNIVLLSDNARPHSARIIQEKILDLGWSVLPHPPYSSDLAPNDFHLFGSLQMLWMTKDFLKIKRKHLWKSWAWNQLNFTKEISYLILISYTQLGGFK